MWPSSPCWHSASSPGTGLCQQQVSLQAARVPWDVPAERHKSKNHPKPGNVERHILNVRLTAVSRPGGRQPLRRSSACSWLPDVTGRRPPLIRERGPAGPPPRRPWTRSPLSVGPRAPFQSTSSSPDPGQLTRAALRRLQRPRGAHPHGDFAGHLPRSFAERQSISPQDGHAVRTHLFSGTPDRRARRFSRCVHSDQCEYLSQFHGGQAGSL